MLCLEIWLLNTKVKNVSSPSSLSSKFAKPHYYTWNNLPCACTRLCGPWHTGICMRDNPSCHLIVWSRSLILTTHKACILVYIEDLEVRHDIFGTKSSKRWVVCPESISCVSMYAHQAHHVLSGTFAELTRHWSLISQQTVTGSQSWRDIMLTSNYYWCCNW